MRNRLPGGGEEIINALMARTAGVLELAAAPGEGSDVQIRK